MSEVTPAVEAVRRLVADGDDPDEILRGAVRALVDAGGAAWAGIFFAESGELVLGPEAGTPDAGSRTSVPVVFEGTRIAELAADGCESQDMLEKVSELVALHCLVGWDTGGVPWEEADA